MVYFDSTEFVAMLDKGMKEIEDECSTDGILDSKKYQERITKYGSDENILSMIRSCIYRNCCFNCIHRCAKWCDKIKNDVDDMRDVCEYWEER